VCRAVLTASMTIQDCRQFYSEEMRLLAGIRTPGLVEAFRRVPREELLGPPPWQIASADQGALTMAYVGPAAYTTTEDPCDLYHNVLVAIDAARQLNNGQPSALARWIDALDLKPGGRVFHLGCGVGYYTAIMAEVVGRAGTVVACEVDSAIAARAKCNLTGYPNVTVQVGDGAAFDPGMCDAMLINAGVTNPLPAWLDRLSEGGRLVLPLTTSMGGPFGSGVMVKITREREGLSAQVITFVAIFSCTSARDPQLDPVIAKSLSSRALLKLKSVRTDTHEPADSCLVHGQGVCLSSGESR